jgi:hypothetical protein
VAIVGLLEYDLALLVGDGGRAQLPFHFVERMNARFGEPALDLQTRCRSGRIIRDAATLGHVENLQSDVELERV